MTQPCIKKLNIRQSEKSAKTLINLARKKRAKLNPRLLRELFLTTDDFKLAEKLMDHFVDRVVYYKDKEVLKYLIRNVSEKTVKDKNKRSMFLNCLLDCAKSKIVETLPGLYKGLKDSSVSNRTIAVIGLCVLANNGVNRTLEGLLFALKDSKLTNASQSDIWRALKSLAKNGNTKAQRVLMNKGLTWWRD